MKRSGLQGRNLSTKAVFNSNRWDLRQLLTKKSSQVYLAFYVAFYMKKFNGKSIAMITVLQVSFQIYFTYALDCLMSIRDHITGSHVYISKFSSDVIAKGQADHELCIFRHNLLSMKCTNLETVYVKRRCWKVLYTETQQ